MRLDDTSMNKLWELMIMIFKWQLFLTKSTQNLMDITFRHLDGIGRLIPEMRKSILIDSYKQILINNWDCLNDGDKQLINKQLNKWVRPYNTKISILIRMGLQDNNAQFVMEPKNEFFQYYMTHLGENIYTKSAFPSKNVLKNVSTSSLSEPATPIVTHEIDQLSDQLGIKSTKSTGAIRKQTNVNNYLFMHTNITSEVKFTDYKDDEGVTITETSFTSTSDVRGESLSKNLEQFMEKLKLNEVGGGQKPSGEAKKVTFVENESKPND
jgi:hypothetical protein